MAFSFLLLPFMLLSSPATADEMESIRSYFVLGRSDKASAEKLKQLTEGKDKALLKAYHGSAWALLAKHHSNPYRKLELLKTGLAIINAAVLQDAADLELRFVRFAIEDNIPSMVPFRSHVLNDKKMLLESLHKGHAHYSTIRAYLLQSNSLTAAEKSKIK